MYVFDANIFITLGNFYPNRFPTIWKRIDDLVIEEKLISTREVYMELDNTCGEKHIHDWLEIHKEIFLIPTDEECVVVRQMFQNKDNVALVKPNKINKGGHVADPFVIALAKVKKFAVVTQESYTRMPKVCGALGVNCMNLEGFFEREHLEY